MKRFSFVTSLILLFLAFVPSYLLCQSLSWQSIAPDIVYARTVVGGGSFLAVDMHATAAGTAYIYTSFNKGLTWSSTASIQWNINTSAFSQGGMYFGDGALFCITNANSRGSGVFRSADSGRTFTQLPGLGTAQSSIIYPVESLWGYGSIVFVGYPYNPSITYLRSLYRSADKGVTWTPINTTFTFRAFTRVGTRIFSAGYRWNGTTYEAAVMVSNDDGISWANATGNLPTFINAGNICSIGNRIFVADARTPALLYSSDDFGVTWTQLRQFPTAFQANGLISKLRATGNVLYAEAGLFGIYTSINQGQSWQLISNSNLRFPAGFTTLTQPPYLGIVDTTVYAGQWGGVYRLNGVQSSVRIAEEHSMRLFPQPASDQTIIEYTLQQASLVKVEVVNSLGASIVQYPGSQQSRGVQRIVLPTENLGQGAYFVRVNIGGKVATVPLQIIR